MVVDPSHFGKKLLVQSFSEIRFLQCPGPTPECRPLTCGSAVSAVRRVVTQQCRSIWERSSDSTTKMSAPKRAGIPAPAAFIREWRFKHEQSRPTSRTAHVPPLVRMQSG